jgi:hypothetical protein
VQDFSSLPVEFRNVFLVDMAFATQARAEIEQRAIGAVSKNRDHVYSLSNDDFLTVGDWAVIPCSGLPV